MSGFSKAIAENLTYKEIKTNVKTGRMPFGIIGAANVHKAYIVHSILEDTGRKAVLIMPDEGSALKLADDLCSFGTPAAVLPAKDISYVSDQVRSREYEQARMGALSGYILGKTRVLVVTADSVLQKTVPPGELAKRILTLKTGEDILQQDLLKSLLTAGYKRADDVEGRGQFASRGGIVDFFPPDREHPIRLEFWGDTIDTISEFDEETQRRTRAETEILLTPATEISVADNEELPDRLVSLVSKIRTKTADIVREKVAEDADAIRNGRDICLDKYLNIIYENAVTPLAYMKEGDLLFVCESGQVKERAAGAVKLYQEELKSALEEGEFVKQYGELNITFKDLVSDYENSDLIYLDNFARGSFDIPVKDLYSLSLGQMLAWNGTLSSLEQECFPIGVKNYTTIVAEGTVKAAKELATELDDMGYKAIYYSVIPNEFPKGYISVIAGSFSGGLTFQDSKVVLITRGVAASKARKRLHSKNAANVFHSLEELHKGDYVVHALHGIGIFQGIEKMTVTGITKDYLKIKYAKGDVLYVPVTQLDLISKYVGPREETKSVKINRIGSGEWEKSRNRVRAAVKDMAKELTALYAQRLNSPGFAFSPDIDMQSDFERRFEYDETDDQLRCITEIKKDMEKTFPMDRLLCGDVGFGKTEVALRAAFKCIADGKQCAILVPTTILAFQHYNNILKRFDGFPVNIEMLSRFRTATEQKKILKEVRAGNVDILVGTHRLISKDVEFKDLGLLIIDEEQRFGVAQKEKMKQKFPNVDVLTLSATPIPRTLNMAMSGIRDMSIIEEAPQDRHPVQSYVLEYDAGIIATAIERELRRGGQVYYMYNNVDSIGHCAAKVHELVPDARIGIAHGKMTESELSVVWRDLVNGEIDVLVCTTIIETGVDVPNVNTLIIENADRLGLSQLHQIRGRIGRSTRRASAYFTFYGGKELTDIAVRRLEAIREYTEFGSGFKIAMRDLELRGAGNVLGAQQHGHMEAVGYDMYLKILGEVIESEKLGDEKVPEKKECLIDIQIDAHIPESYISSLPNRLSMYRRIADIRSNEDAMDVTDELIDRFGDPPPAVEGLIEVALLRNTASFIGIYEIGQRGDSVLLYWNDINMKAVSRVAKNMRGRVMVSQGVKPYVTIKMNTSSDTVKDLKTALLLIAAEIKEEQITEVEQNGE